jgi:hypothetical protein
MDEQRRASEDRALSHAAEHTPAADDRSPILAANVRRLRAELMRDHEARLSTRTIALLKELCLDARRRDVKPERLIVMLKDEIRAATANDEYRRRPLVDEAVTRCIRLFFTDDRNY